MAATQIGNGAQAAQIRPRTLSKSYSACVLQDTFSLFGHIILTHTAAKGAICVIGIILTSVKLLCYNKTKSVIGVNAVIMSEMTNYRI